MSGFLGTRWPPMQDEGIGPRPYTLTRGRTHASRPLRLETMVQTQGGNPGCGSVLPEHDAICRLCLEPRSLAEISGLLQMPFGVTRVLVSDLADSGLLYVHEALEGNAPAALLERVLHGLNRI
ncbi:DUF742 domain-containing protein [Streptomyces sp. NPDC091376]|uniref:DUF742 domain-containing protein n=1 Tax=Streptomyces sp. NPDC091376 TaxID=3365994 RepID=UPI0038261481